MSGVRLLVAASAAPHTDRRWPLLFVVTLSLPGCHPAPVDMLGHQLHAGLTQSMCPPPDLCSQGTRLIKAVEIDNGISTFNIDVQIENSSKQQTATRMSIFYLSPSWEMMWGVITCYYPPPHPGNQRNRVLLHGNHYLHQHTTNLLFEGQNQKTEIRTVESHGHSIHWMIRPQSPPSTFPSSLERRSYG